MKLIRPTDLIEYMQKTYAKWEYEVKGVTHTEELGYDIIIEGKDRKRLVEYILELERQLDDIELKRISDEY